MESFLNSEGKPVVDRMIAAIQENKVYLSDLDGQIGDGDHGMNMNKGFTLCKERLDAGTYTLGESLFELGSVLFNEIGGSMGPIYGTVFMEMGDRLDGVNMVTADVFADMLDAALNGLWEIVEAQVGDKTLIDVLAPARDAFRTAVNDGKGFAEALTDLKTAAEQGMLSTRDLVAKFGRSSRLGERSRGVLDAGSVSCNLLLQAMADGIAVLLT